MKARWKILPLISLRQVSLQTAKLSNWGAAQAVSVHGTKRFPKVLYFNKNYPTRVSVLCEKRSKMFQLVEQNGPQKFQFCATKIILFSSM